MTLPAEGLHPAFSDDQAQIKTPLTEPAEPMLQALPPGLWLWPHPGTVASPAELAQLGTQALADGCRIAFGYFRAALRVGVGEKASRLRGHWLRAVRGSAISLSQAYETVRDSPRLRPLWRGFSQMLDAAMRTAARLASESARLVRPWRRGHAGLTLIGLLLANVVVWISLLGALGWVVVARVQALSDSPPGVHGLAARMPGRALPSPNRLLPRITSTPAPTAARLPTATRPPQVLTATPIPIAFRIWGPALPAEGGWDGLGDCSGSFISQAGTGAFIWPTDEHILVGRNFSARWHPGLDLSAALGAPIYAAAAGVVVYAGWNNWGYGNVVIIDHGDSWHTLYAHLSRVDVACGQAVAQGAVIALAGSTGRSTGPHLHFEMRNGSGRVNPWAYLP